MKKAVQSSNIKRLKQARASLRRSIEAMDKCCPRSDDQQEAIVILLESVAALVDERLDDD